MVNSSDYLEKRINKIECKDFLHSLKQIRQKRYQTRIVVLIPIELLSVLELITGLIKLKIYDLWFLDSFDERDINQFLTKTRDKEGLEVYIKELENELLAQGRPCPTNTGSLAEKIFKPYYIKSNVVAFYSAEDTQTNTGLAILTALNLTEMGFRVALVETVSYLPHLAAAMTIRHPYFNTSHALSMYSLGNNDFLKNCLFNRSKYLADTFSLDKYEHIQYYPDTLYFLPDGRREDNMSVKDALPKWREFVNDLSKLTMFEQDFHFLIYLCNGNSPFNELVINELAYLRFITYNLLPSSIIYAINEEKKGQENTHLIINGYTQYVSEELKELGNKAPLFCPEEFQTDILNYLYFKNYGDIGVKTQDFINNLVDKMGVKLQRNTEYHGLKARLQSLKDGIRGMASSAKHF
ncbi:MAG: hypothetical protein FD167_5213 [bacterium]|nr:MAG: hypothetical protein FD167_5213 [bacterium]